MSSPLATLAVATLVLVAARASAPLPAPTFPPDFTSTTQTDVMVKSGVVLDVVGGACCAADSPGCQLQGMFSTDFVEEQGSKNRTRRRTMCSGGPCVIASLYGDVGKQMMLAPGRAHNSSHEFVCAEYCPLAGDFVSSVQIEEYDEGLQRSVRAIQNR